jgi:hypothetical protein
MLKTKPDKFTMSMVSKFIQFNWAALTLRIPDNFPKRHEKAPIRFGMYNFQKLSETTSLRCNNSSAENSVPKWYG